MKVLQIPNYLYPHIGGIEQVARDIISALKEEKNIEQRVICFNNIHKTSYEIVDGIQVVRIKSIGKFASQELAFSYKKELKKILDEFQPDLIIFHYPNPLVGHFLIKFFQRKFKLIVYYHLDIIKQKILGKFFLSQTKKILNRADRIVATSPNYVLGSKMLSLYKNKITVIPNCVNDERIKLNDIIINKSLEIKNKYKNKIIVFACGRHVKYKGLINLIKASKLLNDDFVIFISGKGELTSSLKKEAKNDYKVHFLGVLSDEELKAYLNACDIFAFPSISKNEAFGIALAEAMAFKKPSVTFEIKGSGVNYVSLNNVTGIEVKNQDVKAFAKALKYLKDNEVKRIQMGENAYLREQEEFTQTKFKKNILTLIGEFYG